MQRYQRPHVYTIAPSTPFLSTLAKAVLSGELLPDTIDHKDPLTPSRVTIYLPTQRSVRLLRQAFLAASDTKSLILPNIKALGDVDEEKGYFTATPGAHFAAPDRSVPPALSPLTRQLILTQLIIKWGETMRAKKNLLHSPDQPWLVPASAADAAWLALNLGDLLDRAISEEVSWDRLKTLVSEKDLATFWQLSIEFLEILSKNWPIILQERGQIDAATRRDLLIAQEADRLAHTSDPVIAAGSTGTLPSTARFLATVARLPHGRLVLPGFDNKLDSTFYEAIGAPKNGTPPMPGHPQYGLKQLLSDYIKILPDEVEELGQPDPALADRARVISHAMLPAPVTHYWPQLRVSEVELAQAFEHVGFVNAKSDTQEARAIAVALREFVEDKEGTAALVTPDRALARRVALELQRWGLQIDDSAGRPLPKTANAVLAQLVIDTLANRFEPVTLLALLKHPLTRFDKTPLEVRRAARLLDFALLRGPKLTGGTAGLMHRFEKIRAEVLRGTAQEPNVTGDESGQRMHPAICAYSLEDWDLAETLCTIMHTIFHPLEDLFANPAEQPLKAFAKAHQDAFNAVLGAKRGTHPINSIGRAELEALFAELRQEDAHHFLIDGKDYPKLFRALLGYQTVRSSAPEDPRLLILGSLEARLINPDFMILAALDEGSWPKQAETDAFMSRPMRADMGMEAPERRIGLAAHDVSQGLGAKRVLLTRAAKRGGTPSVMSRWLQRLFAVLGKTQKEALEARGELYLRHADRLDKSHDPKPTKISGRPNPKPPVEARPKGLSITSVERWVRDPYAIYASNILRLKPIDPLGQIPGFAERGTIIHEALDRFNMQWDGQSDEAAEQTLLQIGRSLFVEEMGDFPDQRALWWPRFQRIAKAYLNWEAGRTQKPSTRYSELYTSWPLDVDGQAFLVRGKIDRLDVLSDGTLSIIDFKTGNPPSPKQVKSGLNAQLSLEVMLHQQGAFHAQGLTPDQDVSEVGWVKLDGRAESAHFQSALEKPKKGELPEMPADLGELAYQQLQGLIRQYRNPDQGYMSRPRPDFTFTYVNPYDHLARVKEWLLNDQEEEE